MVKEIVMTGGLRCLVDDEDYERLAVVHWYPVWKRGKCYARHEDSKGPRGNIVRTYRYMHREIKPAGIGLMCDHKNGNTLDNRRENIRPCTRLQNMANQKKCSRNTSGYKGVTKRGDERWLAVIYHANISYNLGRYDTAEEAARAYDAKAKELNGEFAFLNFP